MTNSHVLFLDIVTIFTFNASYRAFALDKINKNIIFISSVPTSLFPNDNAFKMYRQLL